MRGLILYFTHILTVRRVLKFHLSNHPKGLLKQSLFQNLIELKTTQFVFALQQ